MSAATLASRLAIVALFTRAWIEIPYTSESFGGYSVALFTRAWIEIRVALT